MALSPDAISAIQVGLSLARIIASGVPGSVVICPAISVIQTGLGNYADQQAQAAQNEWQNNVLDQLTNIKNTVGVLQTTTAVIGVGVTASVGLSAVNLWQTLKLRRDVKELKLVVKHGFLDLKEALKGHREEIIHVINKVAQDIKFEQHRLEFEKAYGQFIEANKLIKLAMDCEDVSIRNANLATVISTLNETLAIYNNSQLLSETCAAGKLRRLECAWAIEQTIALIFQLQNQLTAVSGCLAHLQDKICQDLLTVIEHCKTEDELDFIFPEITRIYNHDLIVLNAWKDYVDWTKTLSSEELKLLRSSDFKGIEFTVNYETSTNINLNAPPPEQLLYENLKPKSHYQSLRDQLRFMIKPELRQEHESYISEQAKASGLKALAPSNWQEIPNLTVANLYWYFKGKEATA